MEGESSTEKCKVVFKNGDQSNIYAPLEDIQGGECKSFEIIRRVYFQLKRMKIFIQCEMPCSGKSHFDIHYFELNMVWLCNQYMVQQLINK